MLESVAILFFKTELMTLTKYIAIRTLLNNSNNNTFYNIYFCYETLSEEDKKFLTDFNNKNFKISLINITKFNIDIHSKDKIFNLILSKEFEKICQEGILLYLSDKTIIQGDFTSIFSLELSKFYISLLIDFDPNNQNKYQYDDGVIIFNLAEIRKNAKYFCLQDYKNKTFTEIIKQIDKQKIYALPIKYNTPVYKLKERKKYFSINKLNTFYNTNYSCLYDLYENALICQFSAKDLLDMDQSNIISKNYDLNLDKIPIILATDENYAAQTSVTIVSILENNKNLFF